MNLFLRIVILGTLCIGVLLYPWYISLPTLALFALSTGNAELLLPALLLDHIDAAGQVFAWHAVVVVLGCVVLGRVLLARLWR